ncbi:HEAT repeat domain-containing protein [Nostoc sp. C117]|uniref:HEAT repeat domain-containing protein n=1 Tax=Nostoc sp. C117 TaxID=3349875 RepID=UPI00370D0390
MNNNPNQPREFDGVLGGEVPPPVSGVVLGGIEGVKNRLKSPEARERASALIDALRYQEEGFELVIEALKDSSDKVQMFAARLLQNKGGEKGKEALLRHNPQQCFTMLEDWQFETFYPNIGITSAISTAYNVNLYREEPNPRGEFRVVEDFNLDDLQVFLNDIQVSEVEALACWMPDKIYLEIYHQECLTLINMLCKASQKLRSLKALFIGDRRQHEYKKSRIYLSDMISILESFPKLEVLKIHGNPHNNLFSQKIYHPSLKTLILETADNYALALAQVCTLELPSLEYLELWGGRCRYSHFDFFKTLFSGELLPNLSYLGLPSFENTDVLLEALVQSPIIERLAVLDISMGTLTDNGAENLLNCPSVNRLHTLNISKNCISPQIIQQLSQLDCRLIADSQEENYRRGEAGSRYWALHE